jgi:cytochrome oxidase Cu insertion factor (SCO1/SenC/PrrC family)
MKTIFTILLALLTICFAMPLGRGGIAEAQKKQNARGGIAKRYACPMHPEVTSTRAGKCPKCGMTLRLVTRTADSEKAPASNSITTAVDDTSSTLALRIPDVRVSDQNGKQLNFYSDLIKGKTVAINFIFTTCTTICPPLTATFRRVQQDLTARTLPVQLISISVDPTIDTPERLFDFANKFKAAPGWTFVTGDKADIDSLLKALGAAVADKNDHTPIILIGNDGAGYWTRAYGLASVTTLVGLISNVAHKKPQ